MWALKLSVRMDPSSSQLLFIRVLCHRDRKGTDTVMGCGVCVCLCVCVHTSVYESVLCVCMHDLMYGCVCMCVSVCMSGV